MIPIKVKGVGDIPTFSNLIEENIIKYHNNPAWSSTDIRKYIINPNEWKYNKINNIDFKPTSAMDFGNAFDTLILEPELWDSKVIISPTFNKRTIQGRQDYAEFQSENNNKIIITDQEWEKLRNMEHILKNSEAYPYIENSKTQLSARTTINGIDVQVRPDAIKNNMIIDLKTTSHLNKFDREIYKYRYDIQALFYKYVLNKVQPDCFNNETQFILIAIDVNPPHFIKVYKETQSLPYYYEECCEIFFTTVLKTMKEELNSPLSMVDNCDWNILKYVEEKIYPNEL